MNCPGCGTELLRRELSQPMNVLGVEVRPAAYCDTCCRAGLWEPGSPESLKRLVSGAVDEEEKIRVEERTR